MQGGIMRRWFIVGGACLGLVGLLAGWIFFTQNSDDERLVAHGTVEATTVTVATKVAGRLLTRLVDEGASVTQGQVVAQMEQHDLRDEFSLRRAERLAAQAQLADLRAGSRPEEIRAAEAAVERVKAEATRAGQDADRAEILYAKDVIPRRELDLARAGRASTAAAVTEAQQQLQLVRRGARIDTIRQAQARLHGADAALSLARTRMKDAQLISPLRGVVLTKHAEPGEFLALGSPIVTVARLDEVWVRAYIPEPHLGSIHLGQKVRVTTDTSPRSPFAGTVSFIASEAEFTPRSVQTETERVKLVFRVKVTIANPHGTLKPGMPADVFF